MLKPLVALALIVAVGLAVPAFAGDIVDMPTGNMVGPHHAEFNYIYWDLDNPPGPAPGNAQIFEGFVGITDWLELDAIYVDLEGVDTYLEANAYVSVLKETENRPSLIVGATNLTGSDWLLGSDEISPFILGAYNICVPAGPPSLEDPLIRVHFAWGDKYHEGLFGGVQMMVHPNIGLAAFNYQDSPAYVAVFRGKQNYELRGGWKNGTPFYSLGLFFGW